MDRIRAAIAKARADRHARDSATATPPADRSAAWEALAPLTLDPGHLERNRIVGLRDGQATAALDMMRTRILQQMRANGWRRLAITSPTPGCGKTTVCANLALGLLRQPDLRTVLLDLDLRRPALAGRLGVPTDIDLTRVLTDGAPFAENARCLSGRLAVSTAAAPHPRSAELLGQAGVARTLAEIESVYAPDVTIFDVPPMLVGDDMMVLAEQVDCVLLLAGAEVTTTEQIDLCERELAAQTNVLGLVLNKCHHDTVDARAYA